MITYRGFTDRNTVIDKLVERYNLPPPTNCTGEEFAKFKLDILDKVRLRVIQTFKYWIENFYTFDFDEEALKKINEIILMFNKVNPSINRANSTNTSQQIQSQNNPHATILIRALEKVKETIEKKTKY